MADGKNDVPDLSSIPVRVLVVDDDESHAQAVAESLERINCECRVAGSGAAGSKMVSGESWDVVVTDLQMDDVDGLEILTQVKEELPDAEVIVLTGHGSITSAVTAMQHGAYTYLTKPLDISELRSAVEKASARLRLIRRNAELRRSLEERFGFEGVIGNSSQMHRIIEILKNVSPTDSTILIQGENGTGKELVAKAIHQNSHRKSKPFVPLNISALPDSILESELFGHEQGAFTGASGRRIGKFEHANGGTLFLDEVGEMPMDTQVKMLRVLEERKITRLGANDELDINVRLVAATNANLKKMVDEGTFREDLYYRLNVVAIDLPPLRERPGDIPLLMEHFLKDLSKRIGKEVEGFSRTARKALLSYHWPGNIRQLRNTIESMLVMDTDGLLDVDGLPADIAPLVAHDDGSSEGDAASGADALIGRPLSEVEKYYIQRALDLTDGNREETARLLGIGERTLYRKIKEYDLRK
ncbi:sigma-54-dependent transcriptional regulator [Fuerstiella marisgermanici]|uniref:Transcriptional regulatory protein ZraR n=1 Tax=Fuerstiella marisgermanici TaxID=1891926 RepID=A0A1P8WDE4_9PLAN|nr:sigma-54 dependent transcriptional regulator [Fuerstiella marisgermanici]APZ92086.1 Transcriptional regulatory protein ZraR [Fuerstiella marisgermanici]